eukprot:3197760-Alexandrium_andersonii.AAC.1
MKVLRLCGPEGREVSQRGRLGSSPGPGPLSISETEPTPDGRVGPPASGPGLGVRPRWVLPLTFPTGGRDPVASVLPP